MQRPTTSVVVETLSLSDKLSIAWRIPLLSESYPWPMVYQTVLQNTDFFGNSRPGYRDFCFIMPLLPCKFHAELAPEACDRLSTGLQSHLYASNATNPASF